MTSAGKDRRMELIMPDGLTCINPQDHPVSWCTPGLTYKEIKRMLDIPYVDGFIWHKGTAEKLGPYVINKAFLIHCSAASKYSSIPLDKVTVCTVEEAARLGADGISIHVNTNAPNDREQIGDLGYATDEADKFGMPVLAMMYPRGERLKKAYIEDVLKKDPEDKKVQKNKKLQSKAEKEYQYHVEFVKHAARLGAELRADIIKTNYTGDIETFREVVEYCGRPVVIAGGPRRKGKDIEVLQMLCDSLEAGGQGYSFGRNIFGNKQPLRFTGAAYLVIREGLKPEEAWKKAKNRKALVRKYFRKRAERIIESVAGLR